MPENKIFRTMNLKIYKDQNPKSKECLLLIEIGT